MIVGVWKPLKTCCISTCKILCLSEITCNKSGSDSYPPFTQTLELERGQAFGNHFHLRGWGLGYSGPPPLPKTMPWEVWMGVRKPFSLPPAGAVYFAPPSMDLERRGDGRSEIVFAASAGKLPDPTSPHPIWRGGRRSKTFFVSDRQGIKSSSHRPRNRRGGRHSETVCIVVSKTLGGVQKPSLGVFCIS